MATFTEQETLLKTGSCPTFKWLRGEVLVDQPIAVIVTAVAEIGGMLLSRSTVVDQLACDAEESPSTGTGAYAAA